MGKIQNGFVTVGRKRCCQITPEQFHCGKRLRMNGDEQTAHIKAFLSAIRLEHLFDTFVNNGFETEEDIAFLCEEDLLEIGIDLADERTRILKSANVCRLLSGSKLYRLLRTFNIEKYFHHLLRLGIHNPENLLAAFSDKDFFESANVHLVAHRRRFYNAVSHTRQENCQIHEKAVITGYWTKPKALIGATNNFLCVEASLKKLCDSKTSFQLEFLVDSGSDVVTCRPHIIEELGLPLITKIKSHGIHSTVTTNLYKGVLSLGNTSIEVEIIPQHHESIGSNVMSHFNHYITGQNHIWLEKSL